MARTQRVDVAMVRLWGRAVGAVAWNADRGVAEFEYEPGFIRQGLEIAPITLPLRSGISSFPSLNSATFHGLPGLLADSLPDRFGNRIINAWLARQGRSADSFTPVERLCYMGVRGMGALEFKPAIGPKNVKAQPVEVAELIQLVNEIFQKRTGWVVNLKGRRVETLKRIIQVGSSAGGNRPKAVIAWNPETQEVRSGQIAAPPGFESWLLKFDGVTDRTLQDPGGFGRVEYAYHKMARTAGITMEPCRLLEEGGRAHFLTRRFDRDFNGNKIHMQSLCAMAHYDFNEAGAYGYEQALGVIQRLNLGHPSLQEMFRRMVFNVIARNQDDHTRNIAFLMDSTGSWRLAPAYDVVWAYNPGGTWTNRHQLTINGKRDRFVRADLLAVSMAYGIKDAAAILDQVLEAVSGWRKMAKSCGVSPDLIKAIATSHRLRLKGE